MTQPIRHIRPSQIDPARLGLYRRAIWIAVLGNGTLALAKRAAAWTSGSAALLATAVDSATDLVYTLLRAELHVDVDGEIPFLFAHQISNAVRDAVEALDEVDLAFVHLEPVELHTEE